MEVPFFSFEFCNLQIEEEILNAFKKVYSSKNYILGSELLTFENKFAQFNQTTFCLGVGNGLDALQISLLALGIGKGDEVIIPAHTFIATLTAVINVGAVPILVEPNFDTYNIDTSKIESAITTRTKAIIPVHLYGQPCDMDPIIKIANKYNLFIIEDNAQAQGSKYKGKPTGSLGNVSATSFYPIKNLGAYGDGGAINTTDRIVFEKALKLRNYGSSIKYYFDEVGCNSRLDELQAAFLNVKLDYLNIWNEERRTIAKQYYDLLLTIPEIKLPILLPDIECVFHVFTIRTLKRDELQKYLLSKGIQTLIHYPIPMHLQKAYSFLNYKRGDFPITEEIAQTILSLPLFIGMKKSEISWVCDCIREFYDKGN